MSFPTFTTKTDAVDVFAAADMNNVQSAATLLNKYDVGVGAETVLVNSEVLLRLAIPRALRIPVNLAGSAGSATVAPNASTTLTIRKRASGATSYSTVGTFVFATGTAPIAATSLATTGGAAQDFAAGDELSVIGPASADTLLAAWAFTLTLVMP